MTCVLVLTLCSRFPHMLDGVQAWELSCQMRHRTNVPNPVQRPESAVIGSKSLNGVVRAGDIRQ